jgi:MFS family permease
MIALGLLLASRGGLVQLYASNLLPIGLLGAAGMFSPMMAYVSLWFDHRRGSAIALVSSGQYVAGAVWPPLLLQAGVDAIGWRRTMQWFALLVVLTIPTLAAVFFRRPPELAAVSSAARTEAAFVPVRGVPSWLVPAMLGGAIFCCCVTMSIPLAHIVAYRDDIGIGPTQGAGMLSLQLTAGFVAQQLWGWVADRLGGLRTILLASTSMAAAMGGFLLTQNEIGLFSVSVVFGLAFGGLIPGYILAIREIFPAAEATWRIPLVLFPGASGMAAGGLDGWVDLRCLGILRPGVPGRDRVQPGQPGVSGRAGAASPPAADGAGGGVIDRRLWISGSADPEYDTRRPHVFAALQRFAQYGGTSNGCEAHR